MTAKKIGIQSLINKNPWFARYYDFSELAITGLRDNKEREEIYSQFSFTGKTVLDVGCNLGKNFLFLSGKSPKSLIGVDLKTTIDVAKKVRDFYEKENIHYYETDLNTLNWYEILKGYTKIEKYDFSIFVSVFGTKQLVNRKNILADLIKNTKEYIFFEGHHLENHENYSRLLLDYEANNFEFQGYLRDKYNDKTSNIRPFFVVQNLDSQLEQVFFKIKQIKDNKGRVIVGIEGLAGVGKSTLIEEIKVKFQNFENSLYIDDLRDSNNFIYTATNSLIKILKYKLIDLIKSKINHKVRTRSLNHIIHDKVFDFIVVSDHRVRQYLNHVDVLISLNVSESERQDRIKKRDGLSFKFSDKKITSPNFSTDNFYTIK